MKKILLFAALSASILITSCSKNTVDNGGGIIPRAIQVVALMIKLLL
jgi:hypothetical protein